MFRKLYNHVARWIHWQRLNRQEKMFVAYLMGVDSWEWKQWRKRKVG